MKGPLKEGQTAKTGDAIATISRPVGPTCPLSCAYYPDKDDKERSCYATRGHCNYPTVKKSWQANYDVDIRWADRLAVQLASTDATAFRPHIGGDFLRVDDSGRKAVDRRYLAMLFRACRRAHIVREILDKPRLPIWCYTHAWVELSPHLGAFRRAGIRIFASVHTEGQATDAKRLGYPNVAFASSLSKAEVMKLPMSERPKRIRIGIGDETVPVCPEQYGASPDCGTCFLCPNGSDVGFLGH